MKNINYFLGVFVLMGLLLSACQPAAAPETPPAQDEFEYGQNATVEELEIVLMESFPLQAQVRVSGYLPDGCTELYEITVEQQNMNFILTLTTRRPTGDVACTQALVPFDEIVDLNIAGLEAGTYAVIAQDQEAEFTLDVDNLPPQQVDESDFVYGSDAVVEDMTVNLMESFPVQVSVSLVGYLPDGCTEIDETTSSLDDQTFTIQIVTRRPAGDVACTMAIVPFEVTHDLDVEGLQAGEYTVRYGELSQTFTLEQDNAN